MTFDRKKKDIEINAYIQVPGSFSLDKNSQSDGQHQLQRTFQLEVVGQVIIVRKRKKKICYCGDNQRHGRNGQIKNK